VCWSKLSLFFIKHWTPLTRNLKEGVRILSLKVGGLVPKWGGELRPISTSDLGVGYKPLCIDDEVVELRHRWLTTWMTADVWRGSKQFLSDDEWDVRSSCELEGTAGAAVSSFTWKLHNFRQISCMRPALIRAGGLDHRPLGDLSAWLWSGRVVHATRLHGGHPRYRATPACTTSRVPNGLEVRAVHGHWHDRSVLSSWSWSSQSALGPNVCVGKPLSGNSQTRSDVNWFINRLQ